MTFATTSSDRADLWICARSSEKTPILTRLLQEEAPPDDRNDLGETALHVAATCGNDEAAELLLRHGADLLAADWESGWTPLHRSFYRQHLSTSLLLLRHAQTRYGRQFLRKYLYETRDHDGKSPMDLLSSRRHSRLVTSDRLSDIATNTTSGGLVYTFGKRDYQLGYHLPNADMQVSPRLVELPAVSPIVQLSASKYHTIALNSAGECFVWGFGKGGRLGTGSEFDRVEPTRLTSLETTPIQKVAAGENHTLALSRSGQVFSWGSNSFGQLGHPGKSSSPQRRPTPKRIDAFRFQVITNIAASGCHSAAIDGDGGVVYTWGSNRRGQLGRKEGYGTDQTDATPRSVDALRLRHALCVVYGDYDSVRAEQLALSDWHTCVVLRCSHNGRALGQAWQFGYGSYRPSRVNFPSNTGIGAIMCDNWVPTCKQRGMDIVQVSCAQNHSIALTASGSVFTWGHNAPALSHQSSGDLREARAVTSNTSGSPSPSAPQKVPLDIYGPISSVCASQDHCAVVTHNGDLVTWGCGQQGVLGHGRGNTWQPSPKCVAGVKKAVAVAAGHQHTAVLVAPVHPEFTTATITAQPTTTPSLVELVEREIAAHVDITNCAAVWQFAERYAALRLQTYCLNYMRCNWDAVLEIMGRDRMDALFEIMLPPPEKQEPEEKTYTTGVARINTASKEKKIGKTMSLAKIASDASAIAAVPNTKAMTNGEDHAEPANPAEQPGKLKGQGRRKSKNAKFVPLDAFLSAKPSARPAVRGTNTPWDLSDSPKEVWQSTASRSPALSGLTPAPATSHAVDELFPLPAATSLRKSSVDGVSQRQRKGSVGSHPSASPQFSFSPLPTTGKHMLGYDGIEHEQISAFSLDAFIKQPARRGARGKTKVTSAPTWSTPAKDVDDGLEQKALPKTLKEIQEEEEAYAAREREAKARVSGGIVPLQRSTLTVNSWGLCRAPDHVSLAAVQKLQEEQEFVEQQRQILAEIEREQAEKAKASSAAAMNDRGRKSKSKQNTRTVLRNKNKRNPSNGNASANGVSSGATATARTSADSHTKQKKQKNAKERKAARKAAGETFIEPSASSSAAASVGVNTNTMRPSTHSTGNSGDICELHADSRTGQPRLKRRSSRRKQDQAVANF